MGLFQYEQRLSGISPWLLNIYMHGVVRRHMYKRTHEKGVMVIDQEQRVCAEQLKGLVTEFGRVCKRTKLEVNEENGKVIAVKREGKAPLVET